MARSSRRSRSVRAPQPVPLPQPPIRGMRMNASEVPGDPTLAHYLVNCRPVDPVNGGPVVVRPSARRLGSVAYGAATLFTQFTTSDGTYRSVMLKGGELYTYGWATATWTKVVDSAAFSAASITVSTTATAYAVQFGDRLVVSDGVNAPWYWDGTSGGGLTALTNCPVLYGQPVVYYAKLFGIKSADRVTIVWSEENDPTTGYEAGGYNNAWALTQTDAKPLVALVGMDDGLYYFRERSIGVIRGAVTSDFRTTGVHDGVSTTVGAVSPRAVAAAGQDLWFMDVNQRPHVLTGGEVVACAPDTGPLTARDPFEEPFGLSQVSWYRGTTRANALAGVRCLVIPSSLEVPRTQVYFSVPSTTDPAAAWLVYDAETRLPQAFYTLPNELTLANGGMTIQSAGVLFDDTTGSWALAWVGWATACVPQAFLGYYSPRSDHNQAGTTATPFTARLIGPAVQHDAALEVKFDRLDLVLGDTQNSTATVAARLLTSREAHADALPDALTATVTAGASGTAATAKATLGFNQVGRWARVVLDFSWVTETGTAGTRPSLHGYTLWAIPTTTSPYVP